MYDTFIPYCPNLRDGYGNDEDYPLTDGNGSGIPPFSDGIGQDEDYILITGGCVISLHGDGSCNSKFGD